MCDRQQVTAADIRELLRLVHEIHELPEDRALRVRHLLDRLCTLVHGQVAFINDVSGFAPGLKMQLRYWDKVGWVDPRGLRVLGELPADDINGHGPFIKAVYLRSPRVSTHLREDLVSDRDWHGCEFFNNFGRVVGIDSLIVTTFPVGPRGRCILLGFHRALNDKPFGARERSLIELVNSELGWFYRFVAAATDALAPTGARPKTSADVYDLPLVEGGQLLSGLPRQQGRALARLLAGDSEKEAAGALGLSRHTVHDYVKKLYRRFGVSSRAELMAKVLTRDRVG